MAITFPIAVDSIFEKLRIGSIQFTLPDAMQQSQSAGGEVFTARVGTRLWRGNVSLAVDYDADLIAMEAKLSILREPGASFLVYDPRKKFPIDDPTGSVLASSYSGGKSPKIAAIRNNAELKINGLPVGYHPRPGDMLSFAYGSNPIRYALHQITYGGIADGTGVTDYMDVTPAIRPGATVGLRVELLKPFCKAVIIPNSWEGSTGSPGFLSSGASFQFTQTLR